MVENHRKNQNRVKRQNFSISVTLKPCCGPDLIGRINVIGFGLQPKPLLVIKLILENDFQKANHATLWIWTVPGLITFGIQILALRANLIPNICQRTRCLSHYQPDNENRYWKFDTGGNNSMEIFKREDLYGQICFDFKCLLIIKCLFIEVCKV